MAKISVEWDGRTYQFDPLHPEVGHMRVVREFTGLNFYPMFTTMFEGHEACITAVLWMMKMQAGEPCLIEDIPWNGLTPIHFLDAFNEAAAADKNDAGDADPNLQGSGTTRSSTKTSRSSAPGTSSSSQPSAISTPLKSTG